jgi:monoamine oxidase
MSTDNPRSKITTTRRDALKLLGSGTLAALSPLSRTAVTQIEGSRRVDVVVVGAGFAGMMAARRLIREGRKVVVLEARDRVGGRIKSGKIASLTVDVGGMWVGPTQTNLLALIQEYGLHLTPQFSTGRNIGQTVGKRWFAEGEDVGLEPLAQKEFDGIFAKLDRLSAQISPETPWASPRAEEFDQITVGAWLDENAKVKSVRNLLRANFRTIIQAEDFQVSFLYFLFYIRSGDTIETLFGIKDAAQAFRVREGLYSVTEKLAAELGESMVLEAPARRVSQDPTSITVQSSKGAWIADYCVVAVPPSLSVRIAYDPPLPAGRDILAQRMPMGSVIKWYVAYEKPFWREHGWNGIVNSTLPPMNVCYDVTPAEGAPGLLAGFIDSSSAIRWTSHSLEERKQLIIGRLVDLFGPNANRVLDYEDQNWPAEEWTRGCYGGWMGPGVLTTVGKVIREMHGRICWAGTETSPKWMGYAEGAIRSGERAAAEILTSYSQSK